MCTTACPCPGNLVAGNANWYVNKYASNETLDTYARNVFNRTVLLTTNNLTITPFTLSPNNTYFDNFWDCYKQLIDFEDTFASANPNYQK